MNPQNLSVRTSRNWLRFPHVSHATKEVLTTTLIASCLAFLYSFSPQFVLFLVIGLLLSIPILFYDKLEYLVFFLVALLPFRDMVHIVSFIHSKRLIIWTILIMIVGRNLLHRGSRMTLQLYRFTVAAVCFTFMLIVSLIQTASALYTTMYLTQDALKSAVVSNALVAIELLSLVYMIYYSIKTVRQIRLILFVTIGVSLVIAILGILQVYVGGIPPFFSALFDPEYQYYGRATSIFSNPNILGEFLAPMVGIACMLLFWGASGRLIQWVFLPCAIVIDCWGIYLSSSRAAIIQLIFWIFISGAGFLYMHQKRISWKLIFPLLLVITASIAFIKYYEVILSVRLSAQTTQIYHKKLQLIENTNDRNRKIAMIKSFESFVQHPILGIGYTTFSGKSVAGFEYFGLSPHNQFLSILVELGLMGFVPFLLLFALVASVGLKLLRHSACPTDIKYLAFSCLTAFGTATFGFMFSDSLSIASVTGNLWIWGGCLFWLERQFAEAVTPVQDNFRNTLTISH